MMLPYIIHLLIMIGIYIILTMSLNVAVGFTGLLNLGHIAFFGIGAYTSALLTMHGVPYFIALVLAGVIASLFGFVLVFAVRKLKGDYFALATLGFGFVIMSIFINWASLTRGPLGIPGIPRPSFFGLVMDSQLKYLLFTVIVTVIVVFFCWRLVRSSFGTLLQGVRDDELGLRVLGKNTFMVKAKAMMVSAFFAGVAGSLFAHYLSFIDPSSFSLVEILLIFTMVIVGGIASLKGSIVAPLIIVIIPELLRFLALPSSVLGPLRQILYAVILLAILLLRPRGLFGRVDLQ
ncbi:MAG: branched-chain amino acid ABC transporter permease [Nanoarchaeota archaeon]|nr:branched-chain amino acid ABC transporter permease [Nanoarchaeota archaeon]